MNNQIKGLALLILIFIAVFLTACQSSQPKYFSFEEEAERNIVNYTIDRNDFYGFELLKPIGDLPSDTKEGFDQKSHSRKYTFDDPRQLFTEITLYEKDGRLIRMTLVRVDDNSSRSLDFYDSLLSQARKSYPENILIDSGIGANMKFINDRQQWIAAYAEHHRKQIDNKRYSAVNKPFDKGFHQNLISISFDKFASNARKNYVMVDYTTSAFLKAKHNSKQQLQKKMQDI